MTNPLRAFSVLGLGAVVASGVAWTSGEFERFGIASPLKQSIDLVSAGTSTANSELSQLTKAADGPANSTVDQAVLAPTRIPAFDIVRVQPDGSMVIAGRAAPGATIDIVAGERLIGKTSTDESGSFAFVLDQPLPAGDYTIGLVARVNGETLNSEETAIVQIPKTANGDVLAIVTASGAAPEVLAAGSVNAPAVEVAVAETTKPAEMIAPVATVAPEAIVSADPAVPLAPAIAELRIEAVEIDGAKTFIAGIAPADSKVLLYLGETLIGNAKANQAGRFLVETKQPIPVGTQILRADNVDEQGQVVARAAVPFERVDSEKLAMVAPVAKNETVLSKAAPTKETVSTTAPALRKVDTSVIIRKGDTLWQIARRVYGKGVTFSTIYNANVGQISNPNRIFPGQVFAVPRNTEAGETADFNGIEGQKKEDAVVQ